MCASDFDALQLLDLHGKQSYLLCDITKAYDRLVTMDVLEGYSSEALEGRVEVLNLLKESALLRDGKVQDQRGLDLPMRLLPSALALLSQVCTQAKHGACTLGSLRCLKCADRVRFNTHSKVAMSLVTNQHCCPPAEGVVAVQAS